jgi:hypothetical protein
MAVAWASIIQDLIFSPYPFELGRGEGIRCIDVCDQWFQVGPRVVTLKIVCKVDRMAKLSSGGQTSGKTDHLVKLGTKLSRVSKLVAWL